MLLYVPAAKLGCPGASRINGNFEYRTAGGSRAYGRHAPMSGKDLCVDMGQNKSVAKFGKAET